MFISSKSFTTLFCMPGLLPELDDTSDAAWQETVTHLARLPRREWMERIGLPPIPPNHDLYVLQARTNQAVQEAEDELRGDTVWVADPLVRLENALVTADTPHNKEATLRVIVEKGGDYLVGAKANTSKRLGAAGNRLKDTQTRNALLAIIPFDENRNLPTHIAEYKDDKTRAINLILHAKPIP